MKNYNYKLYNTQGKPICLSEIEANSPTDAIKKAGFENLHCVKTRKGVGYKNARILVYEDDPSKYDFNVNPLFILERVL